MRARTKSSCNSLYAHYWHFRSVTVTFINIPVVRAEAITLQHFVSDITVVTAGGVAAVSIAAAAAASTGQPVDTAEDGSCFAGVGTSLARYLCPLTAFRDLNVSYLAQLGLGHAITSPLRYQPRRTPPYLCILWLVAYDGAG